MDVKQEKIYLAIKDIRALASRNRPDCGDIRECMRCPARIEGMNTRESECLFDVILRGGREYGKIRGREGMLGMSSAYGTGYARTR